MAGRHLSSIQNATWVIAAIALASLLLIAAQSFVFAPNTQPALRTPMVRAVSRKFATNASPGMRVAPRRFRVDSKFQPIQRQARVFSSVSVKENPILSMVDAKLPPYESITAESVIPGMEVILKDTLEKLEALESSVTPTWEGLVEPLEKLSDPLERTWGAIQHLKMVKDSDELRAAVETMQPKVVTLSLRISQSQPIANAFKELKDKDPEAFNKLPAARRRIVEGTILDAELSGASLKGDEQKEFNELQQKLAELSTKFGNNVLDATKKFTIIKTDKADVKGLPESALAMAAQSARDKGYPDATAEAGPWIFTLDAPSYMAVMTYAEDRTLRETMYRAFLTRASEFHSDGVTTEEKKEGDNSEIVIEILRLRKRKAELLGMKHHAEVSMAKKMADLSSALKLLEDLRSASKDAALKEQAELQTFASKECGFEGDLQQWDLSFYAEKMRQKLFALDEEKLRVYFSLPKVMDGLFGLIERLFDVKVKPAEVTPELWDPSVTFYEVSDPQTGEPKAYFYMDPFTRPKEKRGGAWMNTVVGRSGLLAEEGKDARLPVALMVLNQSPPVDGKPSLMKFREVETLFHEMGHALQHMLTTQSDSMVAGINGIEWDAVEQPSQFMENWLYDEATLMGMAEHYETGEKLPIEEFHKIKGARTFRSGSAMARQLRFALTDLLLHSEFSPEGSETPYDLGRTVAKSTEALEPQNFDRFLNSFSHIFAGGYSAGYYSYKWAEVLSADCFAAFEEVGLENEKEIQQTGRRFRDTVLAMGGGAAPMDVFKAFRGREPSVEPLLRHSGLATAAQKS